MHATRLFVQGNFYTQWAAQPHATALATSGGRIVAVGDEAAIRAHAGPDTEVIDLGGQRVLPGLCDSHIHFLEWALMQKEVQLHGVPSLAAMQERIRARVAQTAPGQWVVGRGWVETEWERPVMPERHDLDSLSTDHPMIFWRTDGHGAVVNSRALALAGITRATPDPQGGVIERDESGEPTGRLFELAINLVRVHVPEVDDEAVDDAIRAGIGAAHRLGLTGLHDQRMKGHGEGKRALRSYQRLDERGELRLRLTTNVDSVEREHAFRVGLRSGFGNARLQLGHLKIFVDGSLGSQTAWMLDPFEGTQDNVGVIVTPIEEIERIVREGQQHGWAISVHAIGDRANREMLDIFEELAGERLASTRLPHRIEHVQTIQPSDLPRLARLGITASVQPIHATDDWIAADRLWGERGRNCYTFRSLLDSGATLALGSDAPVADANPFLGIHAAVTRQRPDGTPPGGWYPGERITLEEAIYGYTVGAAAAVGREHAIGRLAPGYRADFVVLDRDLFAIAPEEIAQSRATATVFDGEVVHST